MTGTPDPVEPGAFVPGAFVPGRTLVLTAAEVGALDPSALRALLARAAACGIADLIVEVDDVPPGLAGAAAACGLRLLIGVTCFHEHGPVRIEPWGARRPVGADGRDRDRLEWYVGLLPTDARVVAEIVARCARLARTPGVSGIVLDFIRWPLHWELEHRAGGPRLPASSFDRSTLADFSSCTGIDVPPDPEDAAVLLSGRYAGEWVAYRAATITHLVSVIADVVHDAGIALGAFVVPTDPLSVGQDVTDWTGLADVVYPMAYHAILHRPPSWVGEVATAWRARVCMPVVPIVQLTASPAFSGGWDWGPEFGASEVAEAVAATPGPVGFFPGSAIDVGLPNPGHPGS